MHKTLHEAAAAGDIATIMALSKQDGFDVNAVEPKFKRTAMHYAAAKGKIDALKYLIDTLKADITIKDKDGNSILYYGFDSNNVEVCRYLVSKEPFNTVPNCYELFSRSKQKEDIVSFENAIINNKDIDGIHIDNRTALSCVFHSVDWSSYKSERRKCFLLLLQHNASIHLGDFAPVLCVDESPLSRNVFAETIIQADLDGYRMILKKLKFPPTLEEIIETLGPRKLPQARLSQIKSMLNTLMLENQFDKTLATRIETTLNKSIDLSTNLDGCPEALKPFMDKKDQYQHTLEELVLQLQFERGAILSAFNDNTLLPLSPEILAHKQTHPERYTVDNLWKFIDPKNQMTAILEMHLYPKIVQVICFLAISDKTGAENSKKCLALLARRENLSDYEKAILALSEIQDSTAKQLAEKIDEQTDTITQLQNTMNEQAKTIVQLEKTVSKLSDQAKETNQKIDTLIGAILGKRSIEDSTEQRFKRMKLENSSTEGVNNVKEDTNNDARLSENLSRFGKFSN